MKQKFLTHRIVVLSLLTVLLAVCVAFGIVTVPKNVYADDALPTDAENIAPVSEGDNYKLVTASGADYAIADSTYLEAINEQAPFISDGSDSSNSYIMSLYLTTPAYGRQLIGESFEYSEFKKYICQGMPAGSYELVVALYDDEETLFSDTVEFTVGKRANLPVTEDINGILNGQSFKVEWAEGQTYLYPAVVETLINNKLDSMTEADQYIANSVWAEEALYDTYYTAQIKYNLSSWDSDDYETTVSDTQTEGAYTIYFAIEAPSYYSSIENLASGDKRQNYYFKTYVVKPVAIPVIESKVYNGQKQTADIISNDYYTVELNPGFTDVGVHSVLIKLRNTDYYMWEGESVDGSRVESQTVKFEITKAENSWKESLGITTWTVGQYNNLELAEGEFPVKVEAEFGTVEITVANANNPDEILYKGANGSTKLAEVLAGLKVGTYYMTATVEGDSNAAGITTSIFFKVFPKEGLAWWMILIIVVAALLVVVIILWILHAKGVVRMITSKVMLSIRTQMTMDATIAAVRASMVAEQSRKSIEAAQEAERLEAERKASEEASVAQAEQAVTADETPKAPKSPKSTTTPKTPKSTTTPKTPKTPKTPDSTEE